MAFYRYHAPEPIAAEGPVFTGATLVLLFAAVVRARYYRRTRCLERTATGYLAATAIGSLAWNGLPEFVLMGLALWLAIEALGERLYTRLPQHIGQDRHAAS